MPPRRKETLNRWIAHETARATHEVSDAIDRLPPSTMPAGAILSFRLECLLRLVISNFAKPVLMGGGRAPARSETRAMVAWARDEILKLLHPFMPFITEELWGVTASRGGPLVLELWPRKVNALTDDQLALIASSTDTDPGL